MQRFEGRTVLVTGGARGIGRATALAYLREGARVACADLSFGGTTVVADAQTIGGTLIPIEYDQANAESVAAMVDAAATQLGHIDTLVMSAVYSDRGPFVELLPEETKTGEPPRPAVTPASIAKTIQISLTGTIFVMQAVASRMTHRFAADGTRGLMVLVSSPHALIPFAEADAYNAAKAGAEIALRTVGTAYLRQIRVFGVRPGWTRTEGEEKFTKAGDMDRLVKRMPQGVMIAPEKIAANILNVDDGGLCHGSFLDLDCGLGLPWQFGATTHD